MIENFPKIFVRKVFWLEKEPILQMGEILFSGCRL